MSRRLFSLALSNFNEMKLTAQENLGKNVQHYRQLLELTQEQLGERCGLDRGYISGVERGVRNPAVSNVARIAKALKVTPAQLFAEYHD